MEESAQRPKALQGLAMVLGACLLWGTAFPFLKISFAEMAIAPDMIFENTLFAAYRFLLAGLMLLAYQRLVLRQPLAIPAGHWRGLFLQGLLQTTLQYFFFNVGLAHTSGVKASILNSAGTFMAVLFSHFLYANDQLSWRKALALALGFSGVVLVNVQKGPVLWDFQFLGEGFLILSALVSTGAAILAKDLTGRLSPVLITAYQMILGSLVLFAAAMTHVSPFALTFTPKAALIFLYLAFLSAASFALWYEALRDHPLGKISIYKFTIPVFGVLFSALLLPSETLTWTAAASLALVSLGTVAAFYEPAQGTKKNTAQGR